MCYTFTNSKLPRKTNGETFPPPAGKAEECAVLYLKELVDLNYNNGGFYYIHCLVRVGGQPVRPFSFRKPEFKL